jgi:XapX domain-containing protein
MKIAAGMILGILIGVACRWFDIPVPSPPKLVGALLVVAMTVGYLATDKLIATKFTARGPATTKDLCGGPTGKPVQQANLGSSLR